MFGLDIVSIIVVFCFDEKWFIVIKIVVDNLFCERESIFGKFLFL